LAAAPAAARAQGGAGTQDGGEPAATLLYQNFPNPFPASAAAAAGGLGTCIWFDLGRPGPVRVELFTLRGDRVRTLVPGPGFLAAALPAGRYGRAAAGSNSGCDPRLAWDGTADDGRVVPPGVYLLRLRADGTSQVKKVVFRGR
ncbi:MAG: hypothetical protein ACJ79S_01030, partial [Gemmatimonadaceae bacterium]